MKAVGKDDPADPSVNYSIVYYIYFCRFSPQQDTDVKLDETSDEVLVNMIYLTQEYIQFNSQSINKKNLFFCLLLVGFNLTFRTVKLLT